MSKALRSVYKCGNSTATPFERSVWLKRLEISTALAKDLRDRRSLNRAILDAYDPIDLKALPLLRLLNGCPEIVTIFSCYGHDTNAYVSLRICKPKNHGWFAKIVIATLKAMPKNVVGNLTFELTTTEAYGGVLPTWCLRSRWSSSGFRLAVKELVKQIEISRKEVKTVTSTPGAIKSSTDVDPDPRIGYAHTEAVNQ